MLMVVDDDPQFMAKVQEIVEPGDRVFFARNAAHAKELMGTVGTSFSLVLIDLDIPGQDGFSLIEEMRKHFPDLPLIAISGVFQKHVLESAKALGAVEVLQKPITDEWKTVIARERMKASKA